MKPEAWKDIDRISLEVLRSSKSLDIFPTPVDRIVEYCDLQLQKNVDISKIHPSYRDKANEFLRSAVSKIRGIFDTKKRVIYLDLSVGMQKQNFVKLHETAHGILPWQRKLHEIIGDNDQSLNPDYNDEFESEANYFASATLFQHNRFTDEIGKLNLSIDSGIHIAKVFGASIHATLRRYVECSKNHCALLVLENLKKGDDPHCFLRNFFCSDSFVEKFGECVPPQRLDKNWEFVLDYTYGRKYKKDGQVTFDTANGPVTFTYQFFNNSYNAFVFIHPVGEIKKSRTTFIIKDLA